MPDGTTRKRMTAEELAELRAVVQAAQDHPYPSIKMASTIAAKFADHIAALESENKTLREDRAAAITALKIAEEELAEERHAHSQFGVGA